MVIPWVVPLLSHSIRAEEAVSLSLTIKDRKFEPAELHAPPGRAIEIHVKNLNPIVSEFESSDFNREKIVEAGSQITVFIGPLSPGSYGYFDDFHRETTATVIAK